MDDTDKEKKTGRYCQDVGKLTPLHTDSRRVKWCAAKSFQSCPTLFDPRDGSPPGFPIPGILQARTLEWVAISFSNAGR